MDDSLWTMVSAAGNIEKGILLLLAIFSVVLWSLIFLKIPEMIRAKRNARQFLSLFEKAETIGSLRQLESTAGVSVMSFIFKAGIKALDSKPGALAGAQPAPGVTDQFRLHPDRSTDEIVLLSMQHRATAYFTHLQRGLGFMAAIGSTTPFIGLFGTVVGIMSTFHALGSVKVPSMQVVAPGISGALVATAAGLAVAIPAVIAYYYFSSQIRDLQEKADCFTERMMALIRANLQIEPAKKAPLTQPAPKPLAAKSAQDLPAAKTNAEIKATKPQARLEPAQPQTKPKSDLIRAQIEPAIAGAGVGANSEMSAMKRIQKL